MHALLLGPHCPWGSVFLLLQFEAPPGVHIGNKVELLEGGKFISLEEVQMECFEVIESCNNQKGGTRDIILMLNVQLLMSPLHT